MQHPRRDTAELQAGFVATPPLQKTADDLNSIQANRTGTPLTSLSYTYHDNGIVHTQTIVTDATYTQTYAYSPMNRLASASRIWLMNQTASGRFRCKAA